MLATVVRGFGCSRPIFDCFGCSPVIVHPDLHSWGRLTFPSVWLLQNCLIDRFMVLPCVFHEWCRSQSWGGRGRHGLHKAVRGRSPPFIPLPFSGNIQISNVNHNFGGGCNVFGEVKQNFLPRKILYLQKITFISEKPYSQSYFGIFEWSQSLIYLVPGQI